jgi:hypothetical protein
MIGVYALMNWDKDFKVQMCVLSFVISETYMMIEQSLNYGSQISIN